MNKVYSQVSALNKPLQLTASLLMGVMGSTFMGAGVVLALPTGSAVTSGTATIQQTGSQMTINQASDRAIINWGDFSIGATEQVTFKQPGITSATLNRVTGNTASNIFGVLKANGQIFLINPNGILFGTSAKIDVSGLAASTLNVSDNDFLDFSTNKPYTLTSVSGKNPASVENQGTITVRNSGFAALVAPQVRNSGIINASLGKVVLAGGTAATVDFTGDGLISLTVDPNVVKQVTHTGNITANGGVIALAAGTGGSVLDNVINTTGVIQANSVNAQAGKIILSGGDSGPVAVGGTIRTTGSLTATGNAINVNTANITAPSANFNATGDINFTQPYSSRGSNLTLASTTGNISTRAINTFGGNISMSSAGGITTNSQRLNTSNGALNGGNISLTAGSGNITTGQLLSYSGGTAHGNVGNGGNINLTASNGSISTSGIYSYSDSGTGNSQKGGSVSLNANNGNVTTGGLYSYSASASGVAGNGGAINISASGTNAGNISVSVIQSGSYAGTTAGLGGDVRLIAGGNLTLGSANDFVKNSNNYGNILLSGGNISLTPGATTIRGETITATGNITAANAVNSSIALLATGNISTQGIKTYGNAINLSSSNGGITTNNQLLDTRNGANNGGAITLNAGNGGITTGTLNSYSYSNSGNSGNGGAITLNASNDINTGVLDSHSEASGTSGTGGTITLNATNGSINTSNLGSHSSALGSSGTGGAITLNATNSSINTGYLLAYSNSETSGSSGNGGAITLNASNDINTSYLLAYSNSNSGNSGNGGAITLNATNGSINNGDLKSLSRSNSNSGSSGNGGAITLNASNDINTGVLDSHSEASGTSDTGGTITLNATNGSINTSNLGSHSSALGSSGTGGAITLNASNDINTGYLLAYSYSNSGNSGTGGAITLNASNDINTSYLLAYSYSNSGTSGNGGAITLNATNGSINTGYLLSTSSGFSGAGTGGDINLTAANTLSIADVNNLFDGVMNYGNVSLTGNEINLPGVVRGDGKTLLLQPFTPGRNISVGGSAGGDASTMYLTDATLGKLINGFSNITIGRSDGTGAVTINPVTFSDPVTVRATGTGGTITGTGTITGANGSDSSITLLADGAISTQVIRTYGNAINLTSSNGGINTNGQSLDTTNGGNDGGAITVNAGNGGINTGILYSLSSSAYGNSGNGGAINLTTNNGSINTGFLFSNSFSGDNSGNGGAINLTANNGSINTGSLNSYSLSTSSTGGNGGAINLTATNGSINTGSLNTYSSGGSGAGTGGDVNLTAANTLSIGRVNDNSYGVTNYGNVTLSTGNAGTINATGNIKAESFRVNSADTVNLGNVTTGSGGIQIGTNQASVNNINLQGNFDTTLRADAGDISLFGTTTLKADLQFKTDSSASDGDILFAGSLNSDSATMRTLTIYKGSGTRTGPGSTNNVTINEP